MSLVWTLAVGAASVGIGLSAGSLAVVAFGATGLLDAVGSASLVLQFVHARQRGATSHLFETITLRIVTVGLALTAIATTTLAALRLSRHSVPAATTAGVSISAVSIAVLLLLAARKRKVAARIPSRALYADSWVSAVGAALAVVAAIGVLLLDTVGWWWADPVAALAIGCGAICLSVWLLGHSRVNP